MVVATLATAFARESVESGDTRHLDKLIADTSDPGAKFSLIKAATNAIGESAGLDAVHAFLTRSMPDADSGTINGEMSRLLSEADQTFGGG